MIVTISEEIPKTTFDSLKRHALEYLPADIVPDLEKAYTFSKDIYGAKKLTANEGILDHHLEVAGIITSMRLDLDSI